MQHFSMKEIIRSLPKEKNRKSSWWVKLFIRRISFLFTWFFINIGCSANLVSIISVFIVLLGVIFMAMSNIFFVSMGVILLEFWLVLDCVDGNIARVKKTNSYMGEFFDALSGYAMSCFSLFGIGIAAFHYSSILFGKENEICIILGGLGSLCIMYARLIYQRYSNYCTMTEKKVFGSSTYQPDNYSYSIEDKKRTINFYFIYVEKTIWNVWFVYAAFNSKLYI